MSKAKIPGTRSRQRIVEERVWWCECCPEAQDIHWVCDTTAKDVRRICRYCGQLYIIGFLLIHNPAIAAHKRAKK